MKLNRIVMRRYSVMVLCVAVCPLASGEFLPIVNPGFEETSRPLAIGEQTNGAGASGISVGTRFPFQFGPVLWSDPVEVPGWRTLLRPFGDPGAIRTGVLHPPEISPGVPFITGREGNYLVAAQTAFLQQTLPVLIAPNTRYRLRFLGGIGRGDSDYILNVALLAAPDLETFSYQGAPNVMTLVNTIGLFPSPSVYGTLQRYGIEFITPEILPVHLAGRYLAISLIGSDGIPRGCYDDFSLEALPAPCTFDMDANGQIGTSDFLVMLGSLGTETGADFSEGDLDADGDVDLMDVATLQANYGFSCP
ncbi:MAG: hypothetical protein AB7N71_06020 [Phycisphaerae bacterium]